MLKMATSILHVLLIILMSHSTYRPPHLHSAYPVPNPMLLNHLYGGGMDREKLHQLYGFDREKLQAYIHKMHRCVCICTVALTSYCDEYLSLT